MMTFNSSQWFINAEMQSKQIFFEDGGEIIFNKKKNIACETTRTS